jgi:hypothetical protein
MPEVVLMRRALVPVVVVVLATSLGLFVACGGAQPAPSQPPPSAAGAPPVGVATAGDAGPTTTTTQTLNGGAPGGTRLTALGDGGVDGSPKHRGELGRTIVDIQTIIASRRDDARACYDKALAAHPGIEGTIDIRWTIDPAGKVTEAEVDTSKSELVEPAVANCIIGIIKGIHFNASPKGFETKAHYPFNFHPRAQHTVTGN